MKLQWNYMFKIRESANTKKHGGKREAVRGSAWCSEKQDIKLAELHQIPLEHRKPFKMPAMLVGSRVFLKIYL